MESFGARLKREREQRKISLDDISVATKIAPRFLAALEEEHFDELPGGIFNKGFVRAYARHLGLDEKQAIADFVAASTPVVPEAEPQEAPVLEALAVRVPASRSKRRDNEGIPWGGVAAALLLAAFAFALWGFHSRDKSSPKVAAPPPERTELAQPSPPASSAVLTEAAVPPAPIASNPGTFVVLIRAREDSWVSVTADGKQILQDTLAASTEKSVEARNQIVLKTGNVGALDVSFNGKKLASQGHENQVKTLTFDPNGLRP